MKKLQVAILFGKWETNLDFPVYIGLRPIMGFIEKDGKFFDLLTGEKYLKIRRC